MKSWQDNLQKMSDTFKQKTGALVNSVTEQLEQKYGPIRQDELTQTKKAITEQIKGFRILLENDNVLKKDGKTWALDNLKKFEKETANAVLSLGIMGIDFRATDNEWQKIKGDAERINREFQGNVTYYIDNLTYFTVERQSLIETPERTNDAVFAAIRATYPLLNRESLRKQLEKDKIALTQWNNRLSTEAMALFENRNSIHPDALNKIFDEKKQVAKYLYMLENPTKQYDDAFFKPMYDAIDALKLYLTNPTNGRYINPKETNWFGFVGFGFTRAAKLEVTLSYCDQIVMNATGQALDRSHRALKQGVLSAIIDSFSSALKAFFNSITGSPKSAAATTFPMLTPSPLLPPARSLMSGSSSPSISAPVFIKDDFIQCMNTIIDNSSVMKMKEGASSYLITFQNKIVNNNVSITNARQCADQLNLLSKAFCHAPAIEDDVQYIAEIGRLSEILVYDGYKNNVPDSIKAFIDELKEYSVKKHKEYIGKPVAERSKKLESALFCLNLLSKDMRSHETLKDNPMFDCAFQSDDLGKIVQQFIAARESEVQQDQRNKMLSNNHSALSDEAKRQARLAAMK